MLNSSLAVQNPELRQLSDLTEVSVVGDFQTEADSPGHGSVVRGLVQMPMHFETYGDIKITIAAVTRTSSVRSESVVDATLRLPDHRVKVAKVRWSSRNPDKREYFIDNYRLEPAHFQQLFSAIGLDEFMDNSLKMR